MANWTKFIEVCGAGFDGGTDATDNRVLWVAGATEAEMQMFLKDVPHFSIDDNGGSTADTNVDYILPRDEAALLNRLYGFVVEDMRAALNVADSFMSGFEDDDMQEGIDDMLKQVRDAAMVQS